MIRYFAQGAVETDAALEQFCLAAAAALAVPPPPPPAHAWPTR